MAMIALSMIQKRFFYSPTVLKSLRYSTTSNSYIVLVPEIGEDVSKQPPLIPATSNLPEFDKLSIEKCVAAIAKQTAEFEKRVRTVEESLQLAPSGETDPFRHIFDPLEVVATPLDTTWGIAKTLFLGNQSVMPTKSYLAIHDRAMRARSSKFNSLSIFNTLKDFRNSNSEIKDVEKQRIVDKYILEGKLNGLELSEKQKQVFLENLHKQNNEKIKFRGKLAAATRVFRDVIDDPAVVHDFPSDLLKSMAKDPEKHLEGPWTVTLQPSVYRSFMEYCPVRELRYNVWQANVSKASYLTDKSTDTSINIEELRKLRQTKAKILGYSSFADMSMETKMAKDVATVKQMLTDLGKVSKEVQAKELDCLQAFAAERGFDTQIQFWDIPYWKRKQQRSLFEYEEHRLREYFPLKTVLKGLFKLTEQLFGIKVTLKTNASTWHKDVQYYDMLDENNKLIAGFYLDPYSRQDQKPRMTEDSGYMVAIRNRSTMSASTPLATLIFNFSPPNKDTNSQSLLNYREVNSLFQKFGHALQHLLTQVNYADVAGLSNIEWDAVEICGNVFSSLLNNACTIGNISGHYASGEKLPEQMAKNLESVTTHMAALDLSRELYLSELDLELHTVKEFWSDVVKRLWPKYFVMPIDSRDTHICSFHDIFSDEWSAAYYSHVWSKVIAADIYGAFYEARGNQAEMKQVGERFKNTFLALGGSCHPAETFRRFRGRDPNPKALVKNLKLKQVSTK